MLISRSVSTPTTRCVSSSTGTHPHRRSHMSWAARVRLSVVRQLTKSLVITASTFMIVSSNAGFCEDRTKALPDEARNRENR